MAIIWWWYVEMLNINIALLISSHNMPLLSTWNFWLLLFSCMMQPNTNKGASVPYSCLHLSTLLLILQTLFFIAYHHSTCFVNSVLRMTSKKRLTSIWIPTGANVAGHGCEISASAFKTINYFVEASTFLKVWEVDPFWYWWWGCETIHSPM